jgi:hypothetical protein
MRSRMTASLVRALTLAVALVAVAVAAPAAAQAASPPVLTTAQWTLRVMVGSPGGFFAHASDPDGDAVTITWAFDDGTTATGARVTKTWTTPGAHTARVIATDATGRRAVYRVTVQVLPAGPAPLGPTPAGVRLPRPGPAPVAQATVAAAPLRLTAAGAIALRLTCAPVADCAGTVALGRGGRRLAAAPYAVAAGRTATVALRLPAAAARALRDRPAREVDVVLTLAPRGQAAARAPRTLRTR